MYEGAPDWPGSGDRFWALIEKYGITILYTAPDRHPRLHEVGRRTGPQSTTCPACACSARWASRSTRRPGSGTTQHIGGGRCPIVDTWWQTETGAIMISPLPGLTTTKPASATRPFPGISADVVDEQGNPLPHGTDQKGILVITQPWPSMLRTLWGDDERYRKVYWSKFADRGSTSPATARGATRTAISGCWAAWTTSCWSPATISARWRWSRPWSTIPPSPKPPSSGAPTRSKARPSPPSSSLKEGVHGNLGTGRSAQRPRRQKDRRDLPPRRHPLHRRTAQDPLRQDHAPPAARHRRRPRTRRHDDPRRPHRRRQPQGEVFRRKLKIGRKQMLPALHSSYLHLLIN